MIQNMWSTVDNLLLNSVFILNKSGGSKTFRRTNKYKKNYLFFGILDEQVKWKCEAKIYGIILYSGFRGFHNRTATNKELTISNKLITVNT